MLYSTCVASAYQTKDTTDQPQQRTVPDGGLGLPPTKQHWTRDL